jgi:hypothetical protein
VKSQNSGDQKKDEGGWGAYKSFVSNRIGSTASLKSKNLSIRFAVFL